MAIVQHHCVWHRVIDVLPKQWGSGASSDFLLQLQDKADKHQRLLAVLQEIRVLHVLDPHALRFAPPPICNDGCLLRWTAG